MISASSRPALFPASDGFQSASDRDIVADRGDRLQVIISKKPPYGWRFFVFVRRFNGFS